MLITQVVKKGWYIDFKVNSFDEIPTKYILFTKTIGEEKYGTNSVCYVILRLRRMGSSRFCRSSWLRAFNSIKGEATDKGINGGIGRPNFGLIRDSSPSFTVGRRDMVWWCSGKEGNMVSQIPGRRRGIYMVDVRQMLKLDVDVSINYYDPNWLLDKKLQQLHALGYDYDDAWWEYSPSGKHIHIIIVLKDVIPVKELFDLQFLLGDDPKRAEFNYLRYSVMKDDAIHFNVLYTYKKSITFSDKLRAILRHWFRSLQYSKKRIDGQIT